MKIQKILTIAQTVGTKSMYVLLHLPQYAKKAYFTLTTFLSFFAVLFLFMLGKAMIVPSYIPLINIGYRRIVTIWDIKGAGVYRSLINIFEGMRPFQIKRIYLIHIAYENLKIRKGRSLITIFGMSVGVGIIVFLLALGYGIEKLVIKQVASLNELKIIDVTSGETGRNTLNPQVLKRIQKIDGVDTTIPYISVVGRMNYKNAKTDIVVYAVPSTFLQMTRPALLKGSYFAKRDDEPNLFALAGEVAGARAETPLATYATPVSSSTIHFTILPDHTAGVWEHCSTGSKLIGQTMRTDGGEYQGQGWWSDEYAPFHPYGRSAFDEAKRKYLGIWLMSDFAIFQENEKGVLIPQLNKNNEQIWAQGCVMREDVQIISDDVFVKGQVLGESTSSATLATSLQDIGGASESAKLDSLFAGSQVSTNAAGLEVVSLLKDQSPEKKQELLKFGIPVSGESIMSSGLLNLLNLKNYASESYKVSFILIKSLMPQVKGRVLTEEVGYKIRGIIDDPQQQYIYIPIQDMTNLGITRFSQVKVVLKDTSKMKSIRKEIETMGYKTTSTADTVNQIERFFGNLRGVLGVLGFIALAVASLGMFNTLTVSLLERTREIGGMKTMGMVSGEIQELFLAEAMIMGFAGGLGGLFLGYAVGKLCSYIISIIAIAQGVGYLELTYVPMGLTLFIIISSFFVGVVTGLYPSYRAKKISALNALRYE